MTSIKIKRFIYSAIFVALCLCLTVLQSTGLLTFKINTASVVFVLPFSLLAGFYFKGYYGAVFGLLMGALTDVYSSTLCYNTVVLTVVGFVSGMLITYLFNSNLAAFSVLNISACVGYFFIKWLILYAFSDPAAGYLLVHYTLVSAVYTAVWGYAIYFAINPFYKKMPVSDRMSKLD